MMLLNKHKNRLVLPLILSLTGCGGGTSQPSVENNPPPASNAAPSVNAGEDQTVLEQSQVTLSGSATDSDGNIVSYQWQQTQGTAVDLSSVNEATANFSAPTLTESETLSFVLTVTDNEGASATDTVDIQVNPVNESPMVDAGQNQQIDSGLTVMLSGTADDTDGSIVAYSWEQISGETVTLSSSDSATASFTAANPGSSLSFRLTVTDNEGATAYDTVNISVNIEQYFSETAQLIDSSRASRLVADCVGGQCSILAVKRPTETVPSNNVIRYTRGSTGEFAATPFIDTQSRAPLLIVDMDNDQDMDVVLDDGIDHHNLRWLENTGSSDFSTAHVIHENFGQIDPVRGGPTPTPYVTDFDGDGNLDVVAIVKDTASGMTDMDLFRRDGDAFTLSALSFGNRFVDSPSSLTFFDFDNDGDNDMAFNNYNSGSGAAGLMLATNDGDIVPQTLADNSEYPSASFSTRGVDLDNDGQRDLFATINQTQSTPKTKLVAFFNAGNGDFSERKSLLEIAVKVNETLMVDVDNDNYVDIVFCTADGKIQWMHNQHGKQFSSARQIAQYDNTLTFESMIATDVDGDGDKDIVLSLGSGHQWYGQGQIVWFENQL